MTEKTIAAFIIVNNDDDTKRHRVEIATERQDPSNRHADKVESGIVQRVDWEHWHIVTEYSDGTTDKEG